MCEPLTEEKAQAITALLKEEVRQLIDREGAQAFDPENGPRLNRDEWVWEMSEGELRGDPCATCIVGAYVIQHELNPRQVDRDKKSFVLFAEDLGISTDDGYGIFFGATLDAATARATPRAAMIAADVLLYAIDELGWESRDPKFNRQDIGVYRGTALRNLQQVQEVPNA